MLLVEGNTGMNSVKMSWEVDFEVTLFTVGIKKKREMIGEKLDKPSRFSKL